jgi:hypothetical protein
LFYDFEGDYIVLDVGAGGGGIPMYDQLGQITKDSERGIEYPPMTILEHNSIDTAVYEELSKRTLAVNAIPNIYPISATSKSNSSMAVIMRDKLQRKMFGFLVDEIAAEDYLIRSPFSKEFLSQDDMGIRSIFLNPYVQTSLLINESINLSMTMISGNLKLSEPEGGRKDRYSSLSMGVYLASLFDQELLKEDDNTDGEKYMIELVQHT